MKHIAKLAGVLALVVAAVASAQAGDRRGPIAVAAAKAAAKLSISSRRFQGRRRSAVERSGRLVIPSLVM